MTSAIRRGVPDGFEDESLPQGLPEVEATHVYDDLRAALAQDVEEKIVSVPVPNRPGVFVRYRCEIDFDHLKTWTKRAKDKQNKGQTDQKKLAITMIAATACGIEFEKNGKKTEFLANGEPVNFHSQELQDMLGTIGGVYGAITKMYSSDGHILLTMRRILEEAGYSEADLDDAEGEDPLAG